MNLTLPALMVLVAGTAWADAPVKPPIPGSVNPAVTQSSIGETICQRGFAKSVRPPAGYTGMIKRTLLRDYGIPRSQSRFYELDHLVPLEVGGNPTDPNNLWLELWDGPLGAHAKDKIENRVHRLVCSGRMSLAEGQRIFVSGAWEGK